MTKAEIKKQAKEVYNTKGLASTRSFLKKNEVKFKEEVINFGLEGKSTSKEKYDFIDSEPSSELRFHYYSQMVRSAKTKWGYNQLRAIKFILQ